MVITVRLCNAFPDQICLLPPDDYYVRWIPFSIKPLLKVGETRWGLFLLPFPENREGQGVGTIGLQ